MCVCVCVCEGERERERERERVMYYDKEATVYKWWVVSERERGGGRGGEKREREIERESMIYCGTEYIIKRLCDFSER